MESFDSLDKKAHATKNRTEKVEIYKKITEYAKKDSNYITDMERYNNSCAAFKTFLEAPLKIAILGYPIKMVGQWDPSFVSKGLPGSEECAVYGSNELARRGYIVKVFMDPPTNSIWSSPFSNPQWVHTDVFYDLNNKETFDLVIMWRRPDVETGKHRGKKVILWIHDYLEQKIDKFPLFDGIFFLSESNRQQYYSQCADDIKSIPNKICGNGVVLDQFTKPMNFSNPYSIGYYSNYSRGLLILLLLWQDIRKEFPTATLDIYYGRQTWGCLTEQQLNMTINKIKELENSGVTERGKVGHQELADRMQSTSVLAYPCTALGETFCITVVKAQLAGCIPVTTRIAALDETVHKEAPTVPFCRNEKEAYMYRDKLLETLRRIRDSKPEDIVAERKKYIEFAKQFSWEKCVDKWMDFYDSIK